MLLPGSAPSSQPSRTESRRCGPRRERPAGILPDRLTESSRKTRPVLGSRTPPGELARLPGPPLPGPTGARSSLPAARAAGPSRGHPGRRNTGNTRPAPGRRTLAPPPRFLQESPTHEPAGNLRARPEAATKTRGGSR